MADWNLFEFENTKNGLCLSHYCGPEDVKEIIIPGRVGEEVVSEIGDYAFYRCTGLELAVISEGVETIGIGAFASCTGLKRIGLPDSLKAIGKYCPTEYSETLHNGKSEVTGKEGAFTGCKLSEITIPDHVEYMDDHTYADCRNIDKAIMPENLRRKEHTAGNNPAKKNVTAVNNNTNHSEKITPPEETSPKSRKTTRRIRRVLSGVCVAAVLIVAVYLIGAYYVRFSNKIHEEYQQAEELILQDQYDKAAKILEGLDDVDFSDMDVEGMMALCNAHLSYEDGELTEAYNQLNRKELESTNEEILTSMTSFKEQVTAEYDAYQEESERVRKEEEEQRKKEEEEARLAKLKSGVPYVGMSESDIGKTSLGSPSSTVRHNDEMIRGKSYKANLYDFYENNKRIFTARCIEGKVTQVWDYRDSTSSSSSSSKKSSSSYSKSSSSKKSSSKSSSDSMNASNYSDPEEFYEDNYDDFDGFEDAEVYWEDAQ